VECVRPIKNADELVARFFSPRENDLFQKVPEADKPVAFFNLWTRKEALLKAFGVGLLTDPATTPAPSLSAAAPPWWV